MLDATPRTPVAELFDLANTPEAAAAARALSVPRTRLAAEASFLPGASDAAPEILAALRAGRRVDPVGLPPLAAANLRAHFCAAEQATADDVADLAYAMPAGADEALVTAIDADRAVAGMPPCQPAALAAEIEALTDAHAAALVTTCMAGTDPAGRLTGLLERGPARPSAILRRASAAWTRRTASALAGLQADASAAVSAWQARPDADTLRALEDAFRSWAALSRPQRLVDARAALDHPPTIRAIAPWRAAIRNVAQSGQNTIALPAARLLAALFDDLPGRGRRPAAGCAQHRRVERSTVASPPFDAIDRSGGATVGRPRRAPGRAGHPPVRPGERARMPARSGPRSTPRHRPAWSPKRPGTRSCRWPVCWTYRTVPGVRRQRRPCSPV